MGQWILRAFAAITIIGVMAYGAFLSHSATEANRAFTCSIADLVVIGGGAGGDGVKGGMDHVQAELDFLTHIRDTGCDFIESHPATKQQIDQAIRALERQLEE